MDNPYASLYGNKDQQQRPAHSSPTTSSSTALPGLPWHGQQFAPGAQPTAAHAAHYVDSESQEAPIRQVPAGSGLISIAASGRKRRRFMEPASAADGATAHAAAPQDTVLVWDLDETLILFQSLHDGRFATAFGMQACCRGTRTCMCLGWRAPNEAGLAQLRTWQRRKSWAGSGRMRSWTCAMHTSSSSRSAAGHARGQTLPLQHDCCCLVCMTTATKLSLLWPAGAGHGPDLPGQPGGSG